MKLVIGGTISIILGISGLAAFYSDLLKIICGILPIILIVGGILVIMLKKDEDTYEIPDDSDSASEPVRDSTIYQTSTVDVSAKKDTVQEVKPEPEPVPDDNPPVIEPIQSDTDLIGNEDSLVFHLQSCNFATSKKCTVRFSNREDAIDQGYKPCNICKP